jgi:hypothetical protein
MRRGMVLRIITGLSIKKQHNPSNFIWPNDILVWGRKMCKPFQEVDMGHAKKHEGTGLELSLRKKVHERMGGETHGESE